MQITHTIKIIVVIASILTGLALFDSIVGAVLGLMVSGVLCLCMDAAVELSGTRKSWSLRLIPRKRVFRIAVVAIVLLVASKWIWDATAEKRGELMAQRDVERGHLSVKRYGIGYEFRGDYRDEQDFLKRKYGVELDAVAGCVVTTPLVNYVKGYNSVSTPAIKKKYGRDIFEEYCLVQKKHFLSMWRDQLTDPDVEKRRSAASTLALNMEASDGEDGAEYTEVVPAIVDALSDEDAEVRMWCATGLGNIGPAADAAIPKLRQLSNDPDNAVREAAEKALSRIERVPTQEGSQK